MLKSFYLTKRFFLCLSFLVVLFTGSYFFEPVFSLARLIFILFCTLIIFDIFLLFSQKQGISARRLVPEKLSNGDNNPIEIVLGNKYNFTVHLNIIDEVPVIFQKRDFKINFSLDSQQSDKIKYNLRPLTRGRYLFGSLNVFLSSTLGLISRRYCFAADAEAAVYPSIIQMRQYELYAISNRLEEAGVKKIRRIGHTLEFDQIRNYVKGDDYRSINWKATARRSQVMINQYQEEKSQQVYCVIDMGRSMKMPFAGLSLLDYAINASLVLSNIIIQKHDKAGLLTFSEKIGSVLPAAGNYKQMNRFLEILYRQETTFLESDFEKMYTTVRYHIKQRSLLLLFTNFESRSALERQLNLLRNLNRQHVLVVVIFENIELTNFYNTPAADIENIYSKTIAGKLILEKKQVVQELRQNGINSILVRPQDLTIAVINKYLELKARGLA
ncbi:MAG: DUF58 domain-containing protein [Calditrichae bacterium]|nr:DUF58 domain-containing protein [Calditrichota bacterium]MCB9057410.1 DUF58 domain-containing protein [Calditrichia bacterium]